MEAKNLAAVENNHASMAVTSGFATMEGFQLLQRISNMFAKSSLVPKTFQGNLPDCAIAVNMAQRLNADPLMVMQNLYVVYGTPSWSSKFLIAVFNQCGRYTSIHYEMTGEPNTDSWGCRAWACELATGERLVGPEVTIGIAKREGWYTKNGSKWQTMPEQMLRYRAASWFIRTTAPELSMGLQTVEEAVDIGAETVGVEYVQHELDKDKEAHANAVPLEQIAPAVPKADIPAAAPAQVPEKAVVKEAAKTAKAAVKPALEPADDGPLF